MMRSESCGEQFDFGPLRQHVLQRAFIFWSGVHTPVKHLLRDAAAARLRVWTSSGY
jgi:hypothetical protein